ncbi:predicted protein [Botrytis cinerea T4]|uniref:Uncharacterized protein n=1 Tax=Botryotinia fuckeliana (strain T4) TaxID=999810 RepID=G2XZ81_BOTF4|nr:predicted protein [Botrytis cinerea T4]
MIPDVINLNRTHIEFDYMPKRTVKCRSRRQIKAPIGGVKTSG